MFICPVVLMSGCSLAAQITEDQEPNVLHEPVEVPDHRNPFGEQPRLEDFFFQALNQVRQRGIIPPGYEILPQEWDEEGYPPIEVLKLGRRKVLKVALSDEQWRPRAELWVQGLDILTKLQMEL